MGVTAVFQIIVYILLALILLGTLAFLGRAWRARSETARAPYGVGHLESRQAARRNLLWGFLLLVGGFLCVGSFLLGSQVAEMLPQASTAVPPIPTVPLPTATEPAAIVVPTETAVPTTLPNPTETVPLVTDTPEPLPTETAVPAPTTATVNSGVGVWLRSVPGTASDQLEYLVDGTILTLLDSQQTADDLVWQQVTAPSGTAGWVALDFIVINQP
ncbi:MAG: SH3 domain-containing protein [Ardenticatenaceae bacterium]|nr:SH3 domain-containing protein [Ardenticatenaceae bacterium]